jgi:hypothetical protein
VKALLLLLAVVAVSIASENGYQFQTFSADTTRVTDKLMLQLLVVSCTGDTAFMRNDHGLMTVVWPMKPTRHISPYQYLCEWASARSLTSTILIHAPSKTSLPLPRVNSYRVSTTEGQQATIQRLDSIIVLLNHQIQDWHGQYGHYGH